MAAAAPRLAYQVPNRLQDDDSKLNILLNFREIDDFDPVNVVKQVPSLNRLFEARGRLVDLLAKLDGNDELGGILNDIVTNTEQQEELRSLLKPADGESADSADAEGDDTGEDKPDA